MGTYEIIWVTEKDGPVVSDELVELYPSVSPPLMTSRDQELTLILPAVVLA